MDQDLETMTLDELKNEVRKLRQGIRTHRDASGHDLCWFHPELWSLLPEKSDPLPVIPETCEFLEHCIKYRKSLDKKDGY